MTGPARRHLHLLLAHATDRGAAAVAEALHGMLVPPLAVLWVQPEHLALAHWSHRVNVDGGATTRLALPDGRVIDDADLAVVWNRALALPQPRFSKATAKDRDYAAAEFQALVLSWLAGLRERALPDTRAWPLLAPQPQAPQWQAAARRCGLATEATGDAASAWEVLVAGGHAVGAIDDTQAACCVDVARTLALPVLAFGFAASPGTTPWLLQVDARAPLLDDAAQVQAVAALLHRIGLGATP